LNCKKKIIIVTRTTWFLALQWTIKWWFYKCKYSLIKVLPERWFSALPCALRLGLSPEKLWASLAVPVRAAAPAISQLLQVFPVDWKNGFKTGFKPVLNRLKRVLNWFATGFILPSFKLMYLLKELSVDYKKFKKKHSILLSHTRWGYPCLARVTQPVTGLQLTVETDSF
jgi:hypothetical protein